MLGIKEILVEYRKEPIGLDLLNPRFTWKLISDENGTEQTSYSIKILSGDEIMWDSGIVHTAQSAHVEYRGKAFEPRTRYDVILVVSDNHDNNASKRTFFETGIFGKFSGSWITHDQRDNDACPVFTRKFNVTKEISRGRLYITALGVYDVEINETRVSDEYFSPGWTSYKKRLQYQTYDITKLIKNTNELSVTIANGWYKGNLAFQGHCNIYGDRAALLMEIHMDYSDGATEVICSDGDFICSTGPVRYSELYHGETQDRNISLEESHQAVPYDYPFDQIISQTGNPVRIIERLEAVSVIETPAGEKVIDFGQNLTGFVEFDCELPKGAEVLVRHAEVLDKDGNFYTTNLRAAKNEDRYICSGRHETLKPRFTFHGFRYASIEGFDSLDRNCFRACVLHTDMTPTGHFECSDDLLNQLQHNICWGQKGNFLDVPTDCPQRDERLGWTGDAQVFCGTAAFNFDIALFFRKWLADLAADQGRNGSVPNVVPDVLTKQEGLPGNSAAWGDASVIVPWEMYLRYGDAKFLEDQYESMQSWVEYISREAGNTYLWTTGRHFGDWLALDMEQYYTYRKFSTNSATGATDMDYIASAFFAHSTELLYKTAEVLDYKNDAAKYKKLHERIVEAFQNEYITANGRLVSETQTGLLLALRFNLIETKYRQKAVDMLIRNLKRHNNQMVTGFVGASLLCPVLTENGCHDMAGKLLLQKEYPSWLYPVTKGATTIWERWNGIKPDGSFEDPAMNSFNHYAYGAIGDWIYKYILGITAIEPGYSEIKIAPMPVEGIDHAKGHHDSIHGRISVDWQIREGRFLMDVEIPANCKSRIVLPGNSREVSVGSGAYHFEEQYTGAGQ
ncbi:MAG TPA: family 78 glycoside hydrolase catalytic domain [Clostridia bacterium]|nr:family 78 glycoside hydrolase catalytic domain [Clostridia bacterium]